MSFVVRAVQKVDSGCKAEGDGNGQKIKREVTKSNQQTVTGGNSRGMGVYVTSSQIRLFADQNEHSTNLAAHLS